jgi:hypothetical protein
LTTLTALAEGDAPWGVPAFCIGEFLRVVTHARVFTPPTSVEDACRAVERWLESPTCHVLTPGPRFPGLLLKAAREAEASGNLAFDAQIVALCRESNVGVLITEDRDFSRFPGFCVRRLA